MFEYEGMISGKEMHILITLWLVLIYEPSIETIQHLCGYISKASLLYSAVCIRYMCMHTVIISAIMESN